MELKKSDKANLEKKRGLFFEIGLLIALGVVLLAFELQVAPAGDDNLDGMFMEAIEEEIIPITRQDEPPPPPPEPPKVTDILEIVADDVVVDTQVHIDIEVDLMAELAFYDFTETEMEEEEETILFAIVEDKPTFNGRNPEEAFRDWVYNRLVYPPIAQENGIVGRVITEFTIDRSGNVVDIKVLRSADPMLDNEVVRVLRQSPRWEPGRQRGQTVQVKYQFPFIFRLD